MKNITSWLILHPCMQVAANLSCSFCPDSLSFSVTALLKYAPITKRVPWTIRNYIIMNWRENTNWWNQRYQFNTCTHVSRSGTSIKTYCNHKKNKIDDRRSKESTNFEIEVFWKIQKILLDVSQYFEFFVARPKRSRLQTTIPNHSRIARS